MKKLSSGLFVTVVIGLVLLVILFQTYTAVTPSIQTAGYSMNDSNLCSTNGCFYNDSRNIECTRTNTTAQDAEICATASSIPLSGMFSGTGVLILIIIAALAITIIKAYISKK